MLLVSLWNQVSILDFTKLNLETRLVHLSNWIRPQVLRGLWWIPNHTYNTLWKSEGSFRNLQKKKLCVFKNARIVNTTQSVAFHGPCSASSQIRASAGKNWWNDVYLEWWPLRVNGEYSQHVHHNVSFVFSIHCLPTYSTIGTNWQLQITERLCLNWKQRR